MLSKKQVQTCNNAVKLPIVQSCSFWTDWAPDAYQQTTFALISPSQKVYLHSAANSTEKHYNHDRRMFGNLCTQLITVITAVSFTVPPYKQISSAAVDILPYSIQN
jgi:hypothetical protein